MVPSKSKTKAQRAACVGQVTSLELGVAYGELLEAHVAPEHDGDFLVEVGDLSGDDQAFAEDRVANVLTIVVGAFSGRLSGWSSSASTPKPEARTVGRASRRRR